MSSCNCTGSSNSVCPKCQPDEFAMIPIERRSTDGSCTTLDGQCDDVDKWYDSITAIFQVPPVDQTVPLPVCDPTRYSVGQWIYILGAGRFRVDAITEAAQTIEVRNACTDGAAILGNAVPGTAFQEGTNFWTIDEPGWPHCAGEGLCAETIDCLEEATEVCLPSLPDANDTESYTLFGGLAQFCLHKIQNVFYKAGALCYSARQSIGGSKVNVNGTMTPVAPVIHDPSCGCDVPLELPSNNFSGMLQYCDGNLQIIENARVYSYRDDLLFEDTDYDLTVGDSSFEITLVDKPESCYEDTIALIHVQVFAVTYDSGDYFHYDVEVGGVKALKFGGNEQVGAGGVPFPAHNDNTIPVQAPTNKLTVQFKVESVVGSSQAIVRVWCRGYFR